MDDKILAAGIDGVIQYAIKNGVRGEMGIYMVGDYRPDVAFFVMPGSCQDVRQGLN